MKKKGGGGIMKTLGGIIASLAILGVVLATLSAFGVYSLNDTLKVAKDKALEYAECIPKGTCGITTIIGDISNDGLNINIDNIVKGDKPNKENPDKPSGDKDVSNGGSAKPEQPMRSEPGYKGPKNGEPFVTDAGVEVKDTSLSKLESLVIVDDDSKDVGYSRKEWKHWSSTEGKSCWNTRDEVLRRDAVPGSIKLIDNYKNPVESQEDACAIGIPGEKDGKTVIETNLAGSWIDPYSGDKIKDSSKIDIDHIIPLSKAARSGGQDWTEKEKETFANDLDNLLAVSAKENRSKGDKGPGEYMPKNKSYQCQYAKSYVSIADKYKLTINKKDSEVLEKTLGSCKL